MDEPTERGDAPSGDRRPVVPPSRWWTGFAFVSLVALTLTAYAYRGDLPLELISGRRDKALHFFVAGLLAFFLDGILKRRGVGPGRKIPLAALLILVPAGIEEYLQRYSLYRGSSAKDFIADVAGVVVFVWLSRRAAR